MIQDTPFRAPLPVRLRAPAPARRGAADRGRRSVPEARAAYQPGENPPAALDELDGNNFQILANAILYAAGRSGERAIPARPGPTFALAIAGLLAAARSRLRRRRRARRSSDSRLAPAAPRGSGSG